MASIFIFIPSLAFVVSLLAIKSSFLWWVPLALVGVAGPVWLLVLHFRRMVEERRLELALEEDFVP